MDDDLPTDFQVIVVGTGKTYSLIKIKPGVMAFAAYFIDLFFLCLVITALKRKFCYIQR